MKSPAGLGTDKNQKCGPVLINYDLTNHNFGKTSHSTNRKFSQKLI